MAMLPKKGDKLELAVNKAGQRYLIHARVKGVYNGYGGAKAVVVKPIDARERARQEFSINPDGTIGSLDGITAFKFVDFAHTNGSKPKINNPEFAIA